MILRAARILGSPPSRVTCQTRIRAGGALVRSLAYYIDGFFFGVVAYSTMSKSPLKQRLGDQWGNTAVFRAASVQGRAATTLLKAFGV